MRSSDTLVLVGTLGALVVAVALWPRADRTKGDAGNTPSAPEQAGDSPLRVLLGLGDAATKLGLGILDELKYLGSENNAPPPDTEAGEQDRLLTESGPTGHLGMEPMA